MITTIVRVLLALAMAAISYRASACSTVAGYYDLGAYAEADVVIRAKVIGYRYDPKIGFAYFDLETIETLSSPQGHSKLEKGTVLRNVGWINSTFETPAEWTSDAIIVGVIVSLDGNGDVHFSIIQQACYPFFILKDSEKNRQLIKSEFSIFLKRIKLNRARDYYEAQEMSAGVSAMDARLKKLRIPVDIQPEIAD